MDGKLHGAPSEARRRNESLFTIDTMRPLRSPDLPKSPLTPFSEHASSAASDLDNACSMYCWAKHPFTVSLLEIRCSMSTPDANGPSRSPLITISPAVRSEEHTSELQSR